MAIMTTSGPIDEPQDGINVINIYTRGMTTLGRSLSHLAKVGFMHPEYGHFPSMEHYWMWCKTGKLHYDVFLPLDPWEVKKKAKEFPIVPSDTFEKDILEGEYHKLRCNPWLAKLLKECELPLAHYFTYGGNSNRVFREPPTNQWFWVAWLAKYDGSATDAM